MLAIREEQYAVLLAAARDGFVRRMEHHAREQLAPAVQSLTNEQLREFIERNRKRAEECGIKSDLGMCAYLEIVFQLGDEFEKMPAYPWATPLLNDAELAEEVKLERIKAKAQVALERAAEPERR
jgi:hypothetical protein